MKAQTFIAGLALLSATLVSATPPADSQPPKQPADLLLEQALRSPQAFVFVEQALSKSDTNFDVVVTSTRGLQGKPESVYVRPGAIRIFRADAGVDDFTKKGGWYWRCGDTQSKTQFKQPGALIMVVRDQDGTVHWYSLGPDYSC